MEVGDWLCHRGLASQQRDVNGGWCSGAALSGRRRGTVVESRPTA